MTTAALELAVYGALSAIDGVPGGVTPNTSDDADLTPRIVWTRISSVPNTTLRGDFALTRVRVQVDVYALDYLGAHELAARVVDAMLGAPLTVTCENGGEDMYEQEVKQHRVTMDFILWV